MSKLKNSKDYLYVLLWTSSWWQWPGTALTSVNWAHCAHPSTGRLQVHGTGRGFMSSGFLQHSMKQEEGAGSCKYAICPAKCRSTKSREFLLKTVSIWWAHHATADSWQLYTWTCQTWLTDSSGQRQWLGCPRCPHDAFLGARASLLTAGAIRSLDSAWNTVRSWGQAEIIHCHLSHCGGPHSCNQEHSCGNPDI